MIEEYLVTDILDAELLSEVIGGISADPYEGEYTQSEQTKDERIAELEQENAALLYQILTGEEFTNV